MSSNRDPSFPLPSPRDPSFRLSSPATRHSRASGNPEVCPTRRRSSAGTLPLLALLLTGCAEQETPPPFRPVADVQQLMATVVEPAAEVYWDAVGWIIDASGTQEIRPTTDEEWEAVRNAAYVVAESGNLLMMEGRAVDDGAWMSMSQAMIEVARTAIQAAEARDEAAVFDAGAEIYYACTACHSAYALDTLRPNATAE